LASAQFFDCYLRRAFRETSCFCEHAKASCDWLPFLPLSLAIEVEIYQKSARLVIVADQITHQHVQNVIVDGNDFPKSRHAAV
jgi:hypothetical protein